MQIMISITINLARCLNCMLQNLWPNMKQNSHHFLYTYKRCSRKSTTIYFSSSTNWYSVLPLFIFIIISGAMPIETWYRYYKSVRFYHFWGLPKCPFPFSWYFKIVWNLVTVLFPNSSALKSTVSCNVMPYNLVGVYSCFGGIYCLHLQGPLLVWPTFHLWTWRQYVPLKHQ
jgi:hypothetical protein